MRNRLFTAPSRFGYSSAWSARGLCSGSAGASEGRRRKTSHSIFGPTAFGPIHRTRPRTRGPDRAPDYGPQGRIDRVRRAHLNAAAPAPPSRPGRTVTHAVFVRSAGDAIAGRRRFRALPDRGRLNQVDCSPPSPRDRTSTPRFARTYPFGRAVESSIRRVRSVCAADPIASWSFTTSARPAHHGAAEPLLQANLCAVYGAASIGAGIPYSPNR